jgi:hypothetical protein
MLEYIHHQFSRVGAGDVQFEAIILQHQALLLRVPLHFRYPARSLEGEAQDGGLLGACRT